MDEKILKMIEQYASKKDFFGSVSEKDISNAEKSLGLSFPKSYRKFIKAYGSGGICGMALLGVEGDQGSSVVEATERYRRLGLNSNMIVIYDVGDYFMCMSAKDENDEVYCGDRSGKEPNIQYNSLDEYLIDVFQEGIDNL